MAGLLTGRSIAVLGSANGLGAAVAAGLAQAGARVIGIDGAPVFDHLDSFLRVNMTDAGLMADVAAALPEGLDGLALFPALSGPPAEVMARGVTVPLALARACAARMGRDGAIVTRAFGPHADKPRHLAAVRAALALRAGQEADFVRNFGLAAEPVWAGRIAGWANLAFAQQPDAAPRRHAVSVARMDGHFDSGSTAGEGPAVVAQAVTFLLSDLARGLTGANLAADGGRSARIETALDGL